MIRLYLLSTYTLFKCYLQKCININIKKQSLTNNNFVLVFVIPNSARERGTQVWLKKSSIPLKPSWYKEGDTKGWKESQSGRLATLFGECEISHETAFRPLLSLYKTLVLIDKCRKTYKNFIIAPCERK